MRHKEGKKDMTTLKHKLCKNILCQVCAKRRQKKRAKKMRAINPLDYRTQFKDTRVLKGLK